MTTQISAESISLTAHQNTPVITTELLSQLYGTETANIKMNFSRNTERFVQGKHFFKLEGEELREFKHRVTDGYSVKIARNVRSLILWTERGAARHAKMLETDQAWEVFEKLEDCYFSKSTSKAEIASPVIPLHDTRVLCYLSAGLTVASMPLRDDQIVISLDSCAELFRKNGWLVIKPDMLVQKLLSV